MGDHVRTVLVCVRTPLAAQTIASCAARLGVAAAVRTAVSEMEVMTRLAERPTDVVLVDAALSKPDPAAFTRRVLNRAPNATVVLLGDQEPRAAAAAVAAGARGVIRGTGQDLVTAVTKTLLLVSPPIPDGAARIQSPAGRPPAAGPPPLVRNGESAAEPSAARPAVPAAVAPLAENSSATVVPQQRTDLGPERGRNAARPALTERELQVLRGMADGKSNAEIGRDLYVSEDTVKTHARRLFRKLGARDRAHAVASGFRAGLVT
jgi:DNA-binding NarL/FixJ family response regulator